VRTLETWGYVGGASRGLDNAGSMGNVSLFLIV
jgi:hypothetical protein